jgi:hypothetical protein
MTGKPSREHGALYELTISGPIGPVIRSALRPHATAPSRACTIVRTAAIRRDAVLDLVLLLDRCGLDVEGVFEAGAAG